MDIPPLRIPVFVSAPSGDNLNPDQEASAKIVLKLLNRHHLEWRALGRSDYPLDVPLREVRQMIRHCSGGIILGFEQFTAHSGTWKNGSKNASEATDPVRFPTPWNNLEAGILVGADVPLMIFREPGVSGGVFDVGSSETFVHPMPRKPVPKDVMAQLEHVFDRWVSRVRRHYYGE